MRTVGLVAFACLIPLAGSGQTTHKKRPATTSTKKAGPAKKSSGKKSGTKSATKHSKSAAARHTASAKHRRGSRAKAASWRTRQLAPNPERYREIQQALASKGYLKSAPTGVWDNESTDALRRFQQDQNLEPSGKLNSMSLIALGLGPKREGTPVPDTPKVTQPPQDPTPPAVPPGATPQGATPQSPSTAPPVANVPSSTPPSAPPKPQP